ncbi:NUDIX hydrolase N-terminal domain-containing protein [Rodentibacter sp. Ppn85]|uniref:NUDIX hydrolase n=1 Tax=Rodentibacter sp. Ppn85 TaxID=1908525 RepID=UPI00098519AB|nr:NUDIX hydrolase N-terminal domain-containing protein [Rodentibacter sp. Ppn85]OOF61940.1 hypothetical protein BKL51_10305 [Rodentibacter sp. Ppn85]
MRCFLRYFYDYTPYSLLTEPWLTWAIEIQNIAQNSLTYCKNIYDIERYKHLRDISAEMLSYKTALPKKTVKNLFCNEMCEQLSGEFQSNGETLQSDYFALDELPPLNEAKNTPAQVELCFQARHSKSWTTVFD